jgi:molecular chaperone HtpG
VRALGEFDGKPLTSVMDENLELEPKSEEEQKAETDAAPDVAELLARFKTVLAEHVSEVRTSDRLTDSPSCLVVPDGGLGPYIERILRVQQGMDMPMTKRILEVNGKHPLIRALAAMHAKDPESKEVGEFIELVYDQALLSEGSPLEDPHRVARRLTQLMQWSAETRAPSAG